jgi:DNA (cytosine-5)-methyltransferase 1
VAVVENVVDFQRWVLYPVWLEALRKLGYSVSPHILDAADFGVPQHRVRLFLVCTRSRQPLELKLRRRPHRPVAEIIDWQAGNWSRIRKPGRSLATLQRVANGRREFGARFVAPFYGSGSGLTGRSLDRPIGTLTTRDRWAVIDGRYMRMLSRTESRAAMGFPDSYELPPAHKASVHLLGNAVCPPVAAGLVRALQRQA